MAGLDAAGLLAYKAFDAGASPDDLQFAAGTNSKSAIALQEIFALSQGQFSESPEDEAPREWPPLASPPNANMQVYGIPMLVECAQAGTKDLCRDCFLNWPNMAQTARFHLRLRPEGASWALYVNDQNMFPTVHDEQTGLGMLHAVRSLLYDKAEYDIAFHAAMVADLTHGVMLCAPRESGKSVLAAHLAAQGFSLVSDEPTLLRLNTASISPVEMPISLKESAWELFRDEWPQLIHAPIHVRSDGVRIKLLHLSQDRLAGTARRLTQIVFSKYSPSATPQLEALSPICKLTLLNEGGMVLGKRLNKDKFEQFLRLICAVPAFIAEYSSLQEAVQLIQQVLNSDCSISA